MTTKLVQDGARLNITSPAGGYTVDNAYLVGETEKSQDSSAKGMADHLKS